MSNESEAYEAYEAEKPPYDIHCHESGGRKLNAYKSACVTRLSAPSPMLCCKRCDTGREVAEEFGIVLKSRFHRCDCGKVTTSDYKNCPVCREAMRLERKTRSAKGGVQRKCKSCDEAATSNAHVYCNRCREDQQRVADRNRRNRQKKDSQAKRERLKARIKRDQAKLEAL